MSKKNSESGMKKGKKRQRALVLQGGGALGAYEAGAVHRLVDLLKDDDKNEDKASFDVVAGSSIGAVNAGLLVGKVVELVRRDGYSANSYKVWKETSKNLLDFWQHIADSTNIFHPTFYADLFTNSVPFWAWWQYRKWARTFLNSFYSMFESTGETSGKTEPNSVEFIRKYIQDNYKLSKNVIANSVFAPMYFFLFPDTYEVPAEWENARRYFWSKTAFAFGAPNVLEYSMPQPNMKYNGPNPFFAGSDFFRYNNNPLSDFMKRYWDYDNYKIQTTEGEPRLLVVAVDPQDSTNAVAFDSYERDEQGARYTYYGAIGSKTRVENHGGIEIKHIIASMSTHQRYKYPKFPVTVTDENDKEKKEYRLFWDGAYLSNTPLRQVIHHHRHYYYKVKRKEVPNIQPFIINLYPSVDKSPLVDSDTINDRETDIKFHDRSTYDLKVAEVFSDSFDMIHELKEFAEEQLQNIQDAKKKETLRNRLEEIVKGSKTVGSKNKGGEHRDRNSLFNGRFRVEDPVHVRRKDDKNTVFGKAFDFSSSSIAQLIKQGEKDAEEAYEKMKEEGME